MIFALKFWHEFASGIEFETDFALLGHVGQRLNVSLESQVEFTDQSGAHCQVGRETAGTPEQTADRAKHEAETALNRVHAGSPSMM
jgi:hypothetical protein